MKIIRRRWAWRRGTRSGLAAAVVCSAIRVGLAAELPPVTTQPIAGAAAGPVYLIIDQADGRAVKSLNALLESRLKVLDASKGKVLLPPVQQEAALLVMVGQRTNLVNADLPACRAWAAKGRLVVMDLPAYADLHGWPTSEVRIAYTNSVPASFRGDSKTRLGVSAAIWNWRAKNVALPEEYRPYVDALQAEVEERIPLAITESEDPAMKGYPVGSRVPWCGAQEGCYRQRTVKVPADRKDVTVLARSSENGEAVWLKEKVGQGVVYAFDLTSLAEPSFAWKLRGGFNKYIPLMNLVSAEVKAGRYFNRRPRYDELAAEVRQIAQRYPNWKLETVGKWAGKEVYSATFGDPRKPLYVFDASFHAEDEWIASPAILDFMVYLAEHEDDPEIEARLEQYSIRVVPCQDPNRLEGPYLPNGPRPAVQYDRAKTAEDKIHVFTQLHQGGFGEMSAWPESFAKAATERMRAAMQGRYIMWDCWFFDTGAKPLFFAGKQIGYGKDGPSTYWVQFPDQTLYGLYAGKPVYQAGIWVTIENPMLGYLPPEYSFGDGHYGFHMITPIISPFFTLVETDLICEQMLQIFLTPTEGMDLRPPDWKPKF